MYILFFWKETFEVAFDNEVGGIPPTYDISIETSLNALSWYFYYFYHWSLCREVIASRRMCAKFHFFALEIGVRKVSC